MKPTIEAIFDKIQSCLEQWTDDTKELQASIIEDYAKLIHEMLRYAETL
ncbi:MAG: hypothetical protein ACFFFB_05685 [Candidatus Heimdallarchaeota archaeon]